MLAVPTLADAAEKSSAAIDLYYFGQRDPGNGTQIPEGPERRGGNPLRSETFDYGAAGLDLRLQVHDRVALRGTAVLGWIQSDAAHPIPDTVPDAVTTASPSILTLDGQGNVDYQPSKDLRVSPGFFYHHQRRFFAGGPNFDIAKTLGEGNTVLFANSSLRTALIKQRIWTGAKIPMDWRVSVNLMAGWSQYWTPSFLTSMSLRYTRQSGLLGTRWNYVAIYDEFGRVISLVDERLPRRRHRGQLSLRGRYSWALGWSAGLDTSFYADRWGIVHGSAEASLELPVAKARVRLWYRAVAQGASKYFVVEPQTLGGYHTQDSDLGSFTSHTPGFLVSVPLNEEGLKWTLRASAYGFYRTDGLFAAGGHGGVAAAW